MPIHTRKGPSVRTGSRGKLLGTSSVARTPASRAPRGPVGGEFGLGAPGECVDLACLDGEDLGDDDPSIALDLADGIHRGKDDDPAIRADRVEQQNVVAVEDDVVHRHPMLFPERAVVESPVDGGAVFERVKAPEPRESRRVVPLPELAERDRSELFESLREEALEIVREILPLSGLDQIPAEFDDREIPQVPDRVHRRVSPRRHCARRAEEEAECQIHAVQCAAPIGRPQ